jgi:hypothetical protein
MSAMTWKIIAGTKRPLLISGFECNSINVLVNFLAGAKIGQNITKCRQYLQIICVFVDQEEKYIQKPVGRVIVQHVGSNSLWPANLGEDSEMIESDVRDVTKAIDGTEAKQVHFVLDDQVQTGIDDKPAENDALEMSSCCESFEVNRMQQRCFVFRRPAEGN